MEKNDLISRSELRRMLSSWDWQDLYLPIHFSDLIAEQKAVDAVPVVRCCNCKYGKFDMVDQGYMEPPDCEGMVCYKHDMLMDFADFCSDGVKRDSEAADDT